MTTKQAKSTIINAQKNKNPKDHLRPGAQTRQRVLYMYLLIDQSKSMNMDQKMEVMNNTINEETKEWIRVAEENGAIIQVQVITYGEGANLVYDKPINVKDLEWNDLKATDNATEYASAFELLAACLNNHISEHKLLKPLLVMMSDGQPNDDYRKALSALQSNPMFIKSDKLAVAIGSDAFKSKALLEFTGNNPERVFCAGTNEADIQNLQAGDLAQAIRFVTTQSLTNSVSVVKRDSDFSSMNDSDFKKMSNPDDSILVW
jgi:uncharacterized protein YegL